MICVKTKSHNERTEKLNDLIMKQVLNYVKQTGRNYILDHNKRMRDGTMRNESS